MFSKILFTLSFCALLVAATTTTITEHPPNPSPVDSSDCNSIAYHPVCCTAVLPETAAPIPSIIIGLLEIVIEAGTQLLGIGCQPIIGGICPQAGTLLCCETCSLICTGCVPIDI